MLFLICFLLLLLLDIHAQKVAVLKELNNPDSIKVGNGFIYIQEKTTIYIYSLDKHNLVYQFGKEGEGPGELKINPQGTPLVLTPFKGRVYISSLSKLSIYTKTGVFIKEQKFSSMDIIIPFQEKFICFSPAPMEKNNRKMVMAFFLADEHLRKGKIIYRSDFEISQNSKFVFPLTPFDPFVYGDRVYFVDGINGFSIKVFDLSGKLANHIRKEYSRRKIPSSYKDKTLTWFKTNPNFRQYFELIKDRIVFKRHYPPILTIYVERGRIYAITNTFQNHQRECIVMDLHGNQIRRIFLPISEQYGLDFKVLYTFNEGIFYRISGNPHHETWELYKIRL